MWRRYKARCREDVGGSGLHCRPAHAASPGRALGAHAIGRAGARFEWRSSAGAARSGAGRACWRASRPKPVAGLFFFFLTRQHTAFAEAPPTAGDSGASTRRLVGSERCSWMQRSASAGGGRSTHTIAGTRFPLSSARRSAASCVGWHSTAGTHECQRQQPRPRFPRLGSRSHAHGHTLRHGLFHALIGTEAVHQREPPSAR